MSDYNRATKEIDFGEIPVNVIKSVQTYIEKHNLGNILANPVMCTVSTSEKLKKGLFSGAGPKLLVQTAILTDRWLILADNVDQNALYIKSMQLRDITVEDYEKSSFYKMIPDTGMNVNGRFTDASELGSIFLPLGKDATGEKFKSALVEAVQKAKV
ncbi:MAG: hypothetical protein IPG80_05840 [Anaerolineales bacterium]|jgi:hypothetical protein|uniref:hypothetical protein n=1 Tax=Candidatus Villigracilis vicinus TaxID=3140679 RepID=UPI003135A8F3|nr:hypothetical protein [Anaerolineales bacterium]